MIVNFIIISLFVFIVYFRTLFNGPVSDDITVQAELKSKNYPIRWKEHLKNYPSMILHDFLWKIFKDKWFYHHLTNIIIYQILVCSFYFVGKSYLPENIVFLASLLFIVHPCNCQVAGWISGRYYMVALILGIWALYFNQIILYLLSIFFQPTIIGLALLMNIPVWTKAISILFFLYLANRALNLKKEQTMSEPFKNKNLKLYPRKIIVALKSFAYYFTLALFPLKMGWFHEIGEPIDKKIESFNFHAFLSILLIATILLFIGTPMFKGLFIFCLFIFPFDNLITPALFTSERYMAPALIGFSLFLSTLTINYPIIAAVIITAYFMRTQLELLAYQDDFHLALYSLLNFDKSGYAWCNIANHFLNSNKPSAAFDMLNEIKKRLPTFPTTYYLLYLIYRAVDLMNNLDMAEENLEKACKYGGHSSWYAELDNFKSKLKASRISKFKENVERKTIKQFRPVITPTNTANKQVGVGVIA